jgi:hypothetical protein
MMLTDKEQLEQTQIAYEKIAKPKIIVPSSEKNLNQVTSALAQVASTLPYKYKAWNSHN